MVDQFISAGAGSAASMMYGTEHCSQPLHESLQLVGVSPKANRPWPLSVDYDELSMGRDMTYECLFNNSLIFPAECGCAFWEEGGRLKRETLICWGGS